MFIDFLKDLLFPVDCQGCGRSGAWLCPACFRRLHFNGPEMEIPSIAHTFIAGDYHDPFLAQLLKSFKYEFMPGLAADLGRYLATYWAGQLALRPNLSRLTLIPIPSAKQRERWRGYSQAQLLAQEVARRTGAPLSADLIKFRQTLLQAQLNAAARRLNLHNSFKWQGPDILGSDLVLVDDVATTGATLQEGARALKEAGARHIYALVLAKG